MNAVLCRTLWGHREDLNHFRDLQLHGNGRPLLLHCAKQRPKIEALAGLHTNQVSGRWNFELHPDATIMASEHGPHGLIFRGCLLR